LKKFSNIQAGWNPYLTKEWI